LPQKGKRAINTLPKLIIVDGLPGSGKSTAAQWISEQLLSNGYSAKWHYEISSVNPLRSDLKISDVTDHDLLEHGSKTWENCTEALRSSDQTHVFDAALFQHIILEAFFRNLPTPNITEYFKKIETSLQEFSRALIHFSPDSADSHIAQTYLKRGEQWTNLLTTWAVNSPYAKEKSLKGHIGSLQFWQDYHQLCCTLFDQCRANKQQVKFSTEYPAWDQRNQEILNFLEIPQADPKLHLDTTRFLGSYLSKDTGKRFEIVQHDDHLQAVGLLDPLEHTSVLKVVSKDKITVRGHDVSLNMITPQTLRIQSSWPKIDGIQFDRC
jgi:hypothetical protein